MMSSTNMFVRAWNSHFQASLFSKLCGRNIRRNYQRFYASPSVANVATDQVRWTTTDAPQKRKIIFVLGGKVSTEPIMGCFV